MIDENITFILFGYTSDTLSYGSTKKVLCICNKCGKGRLVQYRMYRNLCINCTHKGDKNHMFGKTGKKSPNYGRHHTEKAKRKISNAHIGMQPTEETKRKLSTNHANVSGENNPNYGKTGNKHPMFGISGKNHPNWKGGTKMSTARANAKRRELFEFIPHNLPQKDFHGHHLDYHHVIYIPKELHTSIYHSVTKNINMDIINDAVCDWYLEYQIHQ